MVDQQILMTADQVANRLAISTRTLWRMVKRGTLPTPLRYNKKLVRWLASDIYRAVVAFQQQEPTAPRPETRSNK